MCNVSDRQLGEFAKFKQNIGQYAVAYTFTVQANEELNKTNKDKRSALRMVRFSHQKAVATKCELNQEENETRKVLRPDTSFAPFAKKRESFSSKKCIKSQFPEKGAENIEAEEEKII